MTGLAATRFARSRRSLGVAAVVGLGRRRPRSCPRPSEPGPSGSPGDSRSVSRSSPLSVPLAFALRSRPGWLPFLLLAALVVLPARASPAPRPGTGAAAGFRCDASDGPSRSPSRCRRRALRAPRADRADVGERLSSRSGVSRARPSSPKGACPSASSSGPLSGSRTRSTRSGFRSSTPGSRSCSGDGTTTRWRSSSRCSRLATLAALFGWLRRRGADRPLALATAALLSHFEPLYRGFTDRHGRGAALLRRAAARHLALRSHRARRTAARRAGSLSPRSPAPARRTRASSSSRRASSSRRSSRFPGEASWRGRPRSSPSPQRSSSRPHRLIRGSLPLSDFDFSLLRRPGELAPRIGETLAAVFRLTPPLAWAGLVALAVLIAAGRPSPAGATPARSRGVRTRRLPLPAVARCRRSGVAGRDGVLPDDRGPGAAGRRRRGGAADTPVRETGNGKRKRTLTDLFRFPFPVFSFPAPVDPADSKQVTQHPERVLDHRDLATRGS